MEISNANLALSENLIKKEPSSDILPNQIKIEDELTTEKPLEIKEEPQELTEDINLPEYNTDVNEVRDNEAFADNSDLVKIEHEEVENNLTDTNLNNGCLDYTSILEQPCSSKAYQDLLNLSAVETTLIKKKKYPCPICRKKLSHAVIKKKHVDNHFEGYGVLCFCGQHFLNKDQYFAHSFTHSVKKVFPKFVPPNENYIFSEVACNPLPIIKRFECDICHKTFSAQRYLRKHEKLHSKHISCTICNKTFTSNHLLRAHLDIHNNEFHSEHEIPTNSPFECYTCSASFEKAAALERHVKTKCDKFKCRICFKSFMQAVGLKLHLNIHLGTKPYTCIICRRTYKSKPFLTRHLRSHHYLKETRDVIKCKICSKSFKCKTKYSIHFQNSHAIQPAAPSFGGEDKLFKCPNCNKKFHEETKLETHLKIYNYTAECKICYETINRPHLLKKHMESHVSYPYVCVICTRKFTHSNSLKRHLLFEQRKDSDEIVKKCELCPQHFFQTNSLTLHIKNVHTEKSDLLEITKEEYFTFNEEIKCDTCSEIFTSKNSLRIHIRDVHDEYETAIKQEPDSDPYKCEHCEKLFINRKTYKNHMKLHNFVGTCLFCNCPLSSIHQLKKHVETHVDQKPFACQKCSREFDHRKDFLRHLVAEHRSIKETLFNCDICLIHYYHKTFVQKHLVKVHRPDFSDINGTGKDVLPLKCPVCERGYKDEEKLQRHQKLHEYRETCVYCKETFYSPSDLSAHLYTHIGKRPYICSLCSHEFGSILKFRNHMKCEQRKISRGLTFQCKICSEGFETKAKLTSHIMKIHSNQRNTVVGAPHLTEDDALFKCQICQKLYIDQDQYLRHVKLHNYSDSCKICSKSFTTRCRTMKHLDEHLGGKPFTCVLCQRTFDGKRSLKDHLIMEQGKNSHKMLLKCEVCGWHYYHKHSFHRHLKVEHNIIPENDLPILPENDLPILPENDLPFLPENDLPIFPEIYMGDHLLNDDIKIEIKEESLESQNFC